ncbi:MAG: ATPase, T2SS/T4P/T4SS family [Candidatus Pacebacteria bacterium]|nr:ATPase, T2SS/T4P/T4SS family [Candidatus Paceibacterota bacterium]
MHVEPQQLKLFLLDAGLINKEQLASAEKISKEKEKQLDDVLVSEKLVNQEDLIRLKAYILGVPFIDLGKEIVPKEVLEIIPEPVARANNIVAFRQKGKELEVAMLEPEDLQTIEFIKKKSNLKILPRLSTPDGIKGILSQYRKTLSAEFGDLIQKEAEDIRTHSAQETTQDEKELAKAAQELPVIKIVESLLKHAALDRASDIHIEPMEQEVLVRYRIDGILRDAMTLPKQVAPGIVARVKVLSDLKLDEHRLPQDGRFKFESNTDKFSVRVSVLPVLNGEKIVMRLLAEEAKGYSLEGIGLRSMALENIQAAIRRPTGMILVTGPTGSGKTTTLYSIMEILNTPEVNISTVEDPIEYRMPRINQTQIRTDIGLSFSNGLRSLLRQDPDIVMVGEIRDNETASLAINAALTGHLVLSTLHTNDASGALPRLIDMKVEPFLIASTVNIILAQRLVRKLYEEKEEYHLSKEEIRSMARVCDIVKVEELLRKEGLLKEKQGLEDIKFYKAKESPNCATGYKGRIGIFEVLPITESIRKLIMQNADAQQTQKQAVSEGMITMVEDGLIKAAQGITSIEEVLRVIMD